MVKSQKVLHNCITYEFPWQILLSKTIIIEVLVWFQSSYVQSTMHYGSLFGWPWAVTLTYLTLHQVSECTFCSISQNWLHVKKTTTKNKTKKMPVCTYMYIAHSQCKLTIIFLFLILSSPETRLLRLLWRIRCFWRRRRRGWRGRE